MRGFKSPKQAQLFLSTFGVLRNHFKISLYKLSAINRREKLREVFESLTFHLKEGKKEKINCITGGQKS